MRFAWRSARTGIVSTPLRNDAFTLNSSISSTVMRRSLQLEKLQLEKRETIADVINLVLGAWLFLTPWIFGFVPNTAASWNAWLSGVAIGVVALAALLAFAEWEEWINLLLGVWVAVSAWAVGFAVHATPTWVHVVTGIFVAVVAGVRLWFMHRTPPRVSA